MSSSAKLFNLAGAKSRAYFYGSRWAFDVDKCSMMQSYAAKRTFNTTQWKQRHKNLVLPSTTHQTALQYAFDAAERSLQKHAVMAQLWKI